MGVGIGENGKSGKRGESCQGTIGKAIDANFNDWKTESLLKSKVYAIDWRCPGRWTFQLKETDCRQADSQARRPPLVKIGHI